MTTTVPARSLWFPLLAPPAAWSVHGLLGWFVGETTCGALTPVAVRLIVAGITVAALLVSVAAVGLGWRSWRAQSHEANPLEAAAHDRLQFMALGGLLVSVMFTIGIGWAGLSAAFLSDCGRMR